MGGYGASRIGMKHPDVFGALYIMSPCCLSHDGTIANERARWLPSFLEGKNKGWFLSMAVWHTAEYLLGGVVCVRRVSGIPLGL